MRLTFAICAPTLQRGLFERHKLIFALMLTNKILVSAGKIKVHMPSSLCTNAAPLQ
jgi:hypothetical protein